MNTQMKAAAHPSAATAGHRVTARWFAQQTPELRRYLIAGDTEREEAISLYWAWRRLCEPGTTIAEPDPQFGWDSFAPLQDLLGLLKAEPRLEEALVWLSVQDEGLRENLRCDPGAAVPVHIVGSLLNAGLVLDHQRVSGKPMSRGSYQWPDAVVEAAWLLRDPRS